MSEAVAVAFRKLSRSGSGDDCGAESMISGGVADPLGQQEDGPEEADAGSCSPSRQRLEHAAGEVIAALHAAKQELAQEMDANLKQLKTVLQETKRIAKEMEAVLKEAKAEPDPEELARGDSGKHQQHQKTQQHQKPQKSWQPPDFKQQCDEDDDEVPAWKPPKQQDDQDQEQAH
jgi:hypothetical protein